MPCLNVIPATSPPRDGNDPALLYRLERHPFGQPALAQQRDPTPTVRTRRPKWIPPGWHRPAPVPVPLGGKRRSPRRLRAPPAPYRDRLREVPNHLERLKAARPVVLPPAPRFAADGSGWPAQPLFRTTRRLMPFRTVDTSRRRPCHTKRRQPPALDFCGLSRQRPPRASSVPYKSQPASGRMRHSAGVDTASDSSPTGVPPAFHLPTRAPLQNPNPFGATERGEADATEICCFPTPRLRPLLTAAAPRNRRRKSPFSALVRKRKERWLRFLRPEARPPRIEVSLPVPLRLTPRRTTRGRHADSTSDGGPTAGGADTASRGADFPPRRCRGR
jgi:hypothetical protein